MTNKVRVYIQYLFCGFLNTYFLVISTETAINIGYSCQLLTDDLVDVFVVDGTTMDEVEKQLRKFKESVKIVNTFHPPSKKYLTKALT